MKKRTTLTLPSEALKKAEEIAAKRHVTLITVVADAREDGLAIVSRAWRAVAAEGAGALAGSAKRARRMVEARSGRMSRWRLT